MNAMQVALFAGIGLVGIARLAFVVVAVGFALWTWRRVDLHGMPWVAVYFLLSWPAQWVTPWLNQQWVSGMVPDGGLFGWSMGMHVALFNYASMFAWAIAGLLAALILMADISVLLSRAGIDRTKGWIGAVFRLHHHAVPVGTVMVCALLLPPVASTGLWLVS